MEYIAAPVDAVAPRDFICRLLKYDFFLFYIWYPYDNSALYAHSVQFKYELLNISWNSLGFNLKYSFLFYLWRASGMDKDILTLDDQNYG